MKKSEYQEIEKLIEGLDDIKCKAVCQFIIRVLRDVNPGDED